VVKRDYGAEYRTRIARGQARGLSRSQARGHPRAGERTLRSRAKETKSDPKLEAALRELRATNNQTKAAKAAGVSTERFRRFLRDNKLATRKGRHWRITDNRERQVVVISEGRQLPITVGGFKRASLVMSHRAAVRAFLDTNEASHLKPFEGDAVTDTAGHVHPLETRPNVLYRLAAAGNEGFEQIYRLVI
jgi:hypothetical protein